MTIDFPVILGFVQAILTLPVALVVIALVFRTDITKFLARVDKAKWGAAELSAPQQASQNALIASVEIPVEGVQVTGTISSVLPAVGSQGTAHVGVPSDCEDRLKAAEANATLWEFRFFNGLFVPRSQHMLDWLAAQPNRVTRDLFDNILMTWGVSLDDRTATYFAFYETRLISVENGLISLTPRAREYLAWEGRNRTHQGMSPSTLVPIATPPSGSAG